MVGSAKALSELEVRCTEVIADYEKAVIELDSVSKAKEELEGSCAEKASEVDELREKVRRLEGVIKESEDTFAERVEATELVRTLRGKLLESEDDLADKRKVCAPLCGQVEGVFTVVAFHIQGIRVSNQTGHPVQHSTY